MSYFRVMTEQLAGASSVVGSTAEDTDAAQAAVAGSDGALAGTPAAGAYSALLGSVDSAVASLSLVSTEISAALAGAASAYQNADQSAAGSLIGPPG